MMTDACLGRRASDCRVQECSVVSLEWRELRVQGSGDIQNKNLHNKLSLAILNYIEVVKVGN